MKKWHTGVCHFCAKVAQVRHTIKEAIELTGKSRRTLYRHMNAGRLAYGIGEDGHRFIDTTELMRVYGELRQPVAQVAQPAAEDMAHGGTQEILAELKAIRGENQALRDELKAIREKLADRPRIEHKPAPEHQPEPGQSTSTPHPYGSLIERLKAKQVH